LLAGNLLQKRDNLAGQLNKKRESFKQLKLWRGLADQDEARKLLLSIRRRKLLVLAGVPESLRRNSREGVSNVKTRAI
jgi:hypothetical protein